MSASSWKPIAPQISRAANVSAKFPRACVLWLAAFSTLSCITGGVALLIWHQGSVFLPPLDVLRFTPFHDYLVPGLVLTLVVGGTQLVCAVTAFRRAAVAPLASVFAGGTLSAWVIAEAAMFRVVVPLQSLYLCIGLVLLSLGARTAWQLGEARARWLLVVTAGELLGFAVPAVTGIVAHKLGASDRVELVALSAAGACEGMLLGAAQAWAWPLPVRRLRYTLLTALAAAMVWTGAMSLVQLLAASNRAPGSLLIACTAATVLFGLSSIGAAQWFELRHYTRGAWRFILWTALAWSLALPFSFAPGPFVDEATPFAPQLALWSIGGLLMALVMALVTWFGVRQLTEKQDAADHSHPRWTHVTLPQ